MWDWVFWTMTIMVVIGLAIVSIVVVTLTMAGSDSSGQPHSFNCPDCGTPLRRRAESCPKCGARFS